MSQNLSFTQKISRHKRLHQGSGKIVYLVHGINSLGEPCWHYLQLVGDQEQKFIQAVEAGKPFDLKSIGYVLTSGEGDHPPQHITDILAEAGHIPA